MTEIVTWVLDQLPLLLGAFLGASVQTMTLRQRKSQRGSGLSGVAQVLIGFATAFFILLAIEGVIPKTVDWKVSTGAAFLFGNVGYRLAVWLSQDWNPLKLLPGARSIELETMDTEQSKKKKGGQDAIRRSEDDQGAD